MSYVVLTFWVCLAGTSRCQSVWLGAPGVVTECQVHAQQLMAEWIRAHPRWEIRGRHKCEVGVEA